MSFSLAPHVVTTETEHGVVLLDERAGRYWQMNSTGAAMLHCLLHSETVQSAIADLTRRYPDAADRIPADMDKLISMLRASNMVVPQ